jgi:predicted  nucleic acid-binding Zn-ribbon protein
MLSATAVFGPKILAVVSKQRETEANLRALSVSQNQNKIEAQKKQVESDLANEQLIRTLLTDERRKYDDLQANFNALLKEFGEVRVNLIDAKTTINQRDKEIADLKSEGQDRDRKLTIAISQIEQLQTQATGFETSMRALEARESAVSNERDGIRQERDQLLADQSKLLTRVENLESKVKGLESELLTNKQAAETEQRNYKSQIDSLVTQLNEARLNLAAATNKPAQSTGVDPLANPSGAVPPIVPSV